MPDATATCRAQPRPAGRVGGWVRARRRCTTRSRRRGSRRRQSNTASTRPGCPYPRPLAPHPCPCPICTGIWARPGPCAHRISIGSTQDEYSSIRRSTSGSFGVLEGTHSARSLPRRSFFTKGLDEDEPQGTRGYSQALLHEGVRRGRAPRVQEPRRPVPRHDHVLGALNRRRHSLVSTHRVLTEYPKHPEHPVYPEYSVCPVNLYPDYPRAP